MPKNAAGKTREEIVQQVSYQDVVERMEPLPDILIEDDCESIGGEKEMTYPHLRSDVKNKIKSIVIKEFGGIDYLPDQIASLKQWA